MKINILLFAAALYFNEVIRVVDSVERRVSQSCQISIQDCLERVSRLNQQPTTTDVCKLMTIKYRSVNAYHCLVRVGMCTEGEYTILRIIACQDSPVEHSESELAKSRLYQVVNETPRPCQSQMLVCIRKYITAIVLKQQEHYCALVSLDINGITSESCMTSSEACDESDYQRIKAAACDEALIGKEFSKFVRAIEFTSATCKHSIEQCYSQSQGVRLLINSEMYCQVMNVEEGGTSTRSCLVEKGLCTVEEFDKLKDSACVGATFRVGLLLLIVCLSDENKLNRRQRDNQQTAMD
ncbi:hypothetical protein Btru_060961 [Bulinus truncatus]|nr:hypothetical protein Btru_060961 [Bulinus truncatus]